MSVNFQLSTTNLVLKNIDESFAQQLLEFNIRNKDYIAEWIPTPGTDYYTLARQSEILERGRKLFQLGNEFHWHLFIPSDLHTIIGDIAVGHVYRGAFQSCVVGYKIGKESRGKGYIPEALASVCSYIFEQQKLHRMEANIMPRNQASIRVVEKSGFVNEGLSRKLLKINGVWEDHLRYVLFNPNPV